MIYKCKICGGSLDIQPGIGICVCEYCGTKQSVPNLEDDRRANLYDRANHFRRNNDFDKAMRIYESILELDQTDAEAYWSLILCKYGIEYVEDPNTHKRVPTCNRTQFGSIYADDDYKAAIQYADAGQRELFEAEAEVIEGIQKEILSISQKEEPFDVFICYKETDSAGKRTQDSVLAQELYYELVDLGFRVFFSRITLEGKPGTAYEPYIFAALNSAKVMVVVGTKAEYLNAVWVKNEWSRYLALIKKGEKKVLIPAYRDMDPYDMPEEFSMLQAQDMAKLGFMQDLVRGIEKIVSYQETSFTQSRGDNVAEKFDAIKIVQNINIDAILDRSFLCLEDRDWEKAEELLEQVLNQEPRNARAYIGKMLIDLKISQASELPQSKKPIAQSPNYEKAIRFADDKTKAELVSYNESIIKRIELERKEGIYQNACNLMQTNEIKQLYMACDQYKEISEYKDADYKIEECKQKIKNLMEVQRKAEIAKREEQEKEEVVYRKKQRKIITISISIVLFIILCYRYELNHQKQLTETLCDSLYGTTWETNRTSLPIKRMEIISGSTAKVWDSGSVYKKVKIEIKGNNWKKIELTIYYPTGVVEGINYTYKYKVIFNGMKPEGLTNEDGETIQYKCVKQ